jgi:hypothetical protein
LFELLVMEAKGDFGRASRYRLTGLLPAFAQQQRDERQTYPQNPGTKTVQRQGNSERSPPSTRSRTAGTRGRKQHPAFAEQGAKRKGAEEETYSAGPLTAEELLTAHPSDQLDERDRAFIDSLCALED